MSYALTTLTTALERSGQQLAEQRQRHEEANRGLLQSLYDVIEAQKEQNARLSALLEASEQERRATETARQERENALRADLQDLTRRFEALNTAYVHTYDHVQRIHEKLEEVEKIALWTMRHYNHHYHDFHSYTPHGSGKGQTTQPLSYPPN
jgi:chromosome segregation ATPase